MTPEATLVSVVMINYNGLPWLEIAVDSVLSTQGARIELLVVDDCSKDGSRAYLTGKAAVDPRLKPVFPAENLGISGARNAGMAMATGKYISLVDSDDRFLPDTVARQIAAFERLQAKCPTLSLLTSDAWLINEAGERKGRYISRDWWGRETCENPPLWTLPSTFFFRRDHAAGFHAPYRSADAPIFINRMLALGPIGFLGEPLVEYRLRMASDTNKRGAIVLHTMQAAELSKRSNRLDNPIPLEEVPSPKWREVVAWVCGRNAKNAAANGMHVRAAFELAKAMTVRPIQTCEKLLRTLRTVGKRFTP